MPMEPPFLIRMENMPNFSDVRVEEALRFVQELNGLNHGLFVTSREFDLGKAAFMPLAYSEYRTYKPYPWRIKKYSDFE